jgi:hypothetical protein
MLDYEVLLDLSLDQIDTIKDFFLYKCYRCDTHHTGYHFNPKAFSISWTDTPIAPFGICYVSLDVSVLGPTLYYINKEGKLILAQHQLKKLQRLVRKYQKEKLDFIVQKLRQRELDGKKFSRIRSK